MINDLKPKYVIDNLIIQQDNENSSLFIVYNRSERRVASFKKNTGEGDRFMSQHHGLKRWVEVQPDQADND